MLEQRPSFLSIQEGEQAILNCTYQKKTLFNFLWFRQDPGKGLVSQASPKEQEDKNFKELGKEKSYSVLHITASDPGDSATYVCALQHSALKAPAVCTATLRLVWSVGDSEGVFLIYRGNYFYNLCLQTDVKDNVGFSCVMNLNLC